MATTQELTTVRPLTQSAPGSHRRVSVGTVVRHAIIIFFLLVVLLPLTWVLLLSIRSIPDAYTAGFWPRAFDFSHYTYVLNGIPTLARNMLNSIVVTAGTVVITTVASTLAGYALVHLRRLPGRPMILALLVASMYFPTRVTSLIALFEIQRGLGLINNTLGLILPYVTLNLALSVFIMRGMFEQISSEIADAALIDGAGAVRTLWSVMMPLVRNGIVVVIMVNFVTAWGEYLLAFTLTNDQEARTMPVVLATALGGMGQWAWPRIAAVYIMVITPGIAAFAVSQRWFMKGLTEGALRG
ncbi:MAG: carbohydrate ABC transporter permease [Chloroflexota bacterium]|nr:carbohydrate ABC transporter permease [Chloroflexota bacterium]